MKILVLNYEFPPVGGGGGQACADVCAALAKRGHALRVLTAHAEGLAHSEERDGYRVVRVARSRKSRFRASFLDMLAYLTGAFLPGLKMIREWQPDIMHVHFAVPTGALAYVLNLFTGVPYVLTAHLGDVPGGVPQKTDRWFRWIYPFTHLIWKRAAAVTAVSDFTRNLAARHYPVSIAVVPNGVPLADLMPEQIEVHDPVRLIFAGRFQPQKNLLSLIEILSRLKQLSWQLTLIGDGPLRMQLEEAVSDHELTERIEFTGWIDTDEVLRRFRGGDVLVMPSLSEGLPVVGVQAIASGLAIVGTRAGGLAELIHDRENGRLCDVGADDCVEQALGWVMSNMDRLKQLKAASLVHARQYDVANIANAYEELFCESIRSK